MSSDYNRRQTAFDGHRERGENKMPQSATKNILGFGTPKSSKKSPGEMNDILAALDKSNATIEFALDGTILTANENFLNVMGYTLEEIKGRHHSMFAEPEYAASQDYKDFWKKLNNGEFQAAQYKRIGKGGKEIWIEASYNPIFDKNGQPYKVIKYATDITQQRLKQAELTGTIDAIDRSQAVISFEMDGTVRRQGILDTAHKNIRCASGSLV
jgi:methyl-accepting chemotaxis protein